MFNMQCRKDTFIPCGASKSIGVTNQLLFAFLIQTITTAYCSIEPTPEIWPTDYGPEAIETGK